MLRPSLFSPARVGVSAAGLAIGLSGLVAVFLAGCSTSPTVPEYRAEKNQLVVTRGTFEDRVVLTGELESADSAELSVPRTRSWQVSIRWLAEHGSQVAAGERLVELDNSGVSEALRELELAIVRAENELLATGASDALSLADKELEVARQRVAVAKARIDAELPVTLLPRREWQDNQLALERARTAHATAIDERAAAKRSAALEREVKEIELGKAKRDYERTTAQLDALVLSAPRDGVVVIADHPWFGRRLQVGDTVQPGFLAAEVSNLERMQVVARLSDVDDGRIAVGMAAECILDAHPGRRFAGRVETIREVAKEAGEKSTRRFFEVAVTLDQTDTEVMQPGMSVRVDVLAQRAESELLAPRAGLLIPAPGSDAPVTARVVDGPTREVEIERCSARLCVVASGLREGERLARPAGR